MVLYKFKDNNFWFYVEFKNKKLIYYKELNGTKDYNLSKDEKDLIDQVVKQVTPSNNLILTNVIEDNGYKYKIFYDKKTGINYIDSLDKSNFIKKLIYDINNSEDFFYEKELAKQKEYPSFFKRTVYVGKKMLVVFLSVLAFINFSYVVYEVGSEINTNILTTRMKDMEIVSPDELIIKVRQALSKNPHLKDDEKEEIEKVSHSLVYNLRNIDIKNIEKILESLKIEYHNEYKKYTEAYYIEGEYYFYSNVIKFYCANSLKDVDPVVFSHEVGHAFQTKNYVKHNRFLIEATNALFNSKYNKCNDDSYKYLFNYAKALMEIIGVEPFKQFQGVENEQYFIDALMKIDNNEDKAISLINNLEWMKIFIENNYSKNKINQLNEKIFNQIKNYYDKKTGNKMEDDLIMLYYLNEDKFESRLGELFNFDPKDATVHVVDNYMEYFDPPSKINQLLTINMYKNTWDDEYIYCFYVTQETRNVGVEGFSIDQFEEHQWKDLNIPFENPNASVRM